MSTPPFPRKTLLPFALLMFLMSCSLLVTQDVSVKAQGCVPLEGTDIFWPQGTSTTPTVVTVFLDDSATGWTDSVEINALKAAFTAWSSNQGAAGCNCHVTFQYASTPGTGTYQLKVLREVPSSGWFDRGEFHANNVNALGLVRATIQIHPNTTYHCIDDSDGS